MGHFERGEIHGLTPDAFPQRRPSLYQTATRIGPPLRPPPNRVLLSPKRRPQIPAIFSGRSFRVPTTGLRLTYRDRISRKGIEEQLRESNLLLQKRQDEMDGELALAAHVQQSLAPHSLIWKNLAVEAYYSPAGTIGGDFGVVLPQGDDFLSIVISDVSGHGVGSALMANRIYSETLHALGRKSDPESCCRSCIISYIPGSQWTGFSSLWPRPVLARMDVAKFFCRGPAASITHLKWHFPPA